MSTSEVLQTEYLQNGEWLSWDDVEQELINREVDIDITKNN